MTNSTAASRIDLKSLPPSAVEISPLGLFAVGGGVPASSSISWIPPGKRGWTPVQCFVFKSGDKALVMDCGLPAHRSEISIGLDAMLNDCHSPRLLVSRWEPDAIGSLPWLIERYGVTEVLSYGGINPLDFFEGLEFAAAQSIAETAAAPAKLVPFAPGAIIEVSDLRIEVLTGSLRLLLTSLFYEHTTRTLFTADTFGFLKNLRSPTPFVTTPSDKDLRPDIVREALRRKFDWLSGADTETIADDIATLTACFQIDRVCPSFGGVIEGRQSVEKLFSSLRTALRQLSSERATSALADFDFDRVRIC